MSRGRLDGKTAIVTGGLSGIGRAITSLFVDEGATVIVADRADRSRDDGRPASELVAAGGRRIRFVQADVTAAADVRRIFDDVVHPDVVVNNAGVVAFKPIVDLSEEDYDCVMEVNVKGVFLVMREALARWRTGNRKGTIVNVASNFAFVGARGASVYCASKGAVVSLTKAAAAEVGDEGIRINALCPGATATELNRAHRQEPGVTEDWMRRTPLRHAEGAFLATPEQIAPAALFLASDESSYMTGSALIVDGGWNCE